MDISWATYNGQERNIHFKKYNKGSFTYYEWTVDNFRATHSEDDSRKYPYCVPQIVYYVKSYPTKSGPHKVLSCMDDLYEGYLPSIFNLEEKPNPDLE